MTAELTSPCAQCPWRLANQGKRHFGSFYTKANLRRLWNQIRNGGTQQSCHLTDPAHPDHVKAGAKENAKAQECPGSVILIRRELRRMADPDGQITAASSKRYLALRKKGITKRGFIYWLIGRIALAGKPALIGGEPPIPEIADDVAIGLPAELEG